MTEQIPSLAYWFAAEPKLPYGDGRPVIIGETLRVKPPLKLCKHGLHWSVDPLDALQYASGNLLYQVRPDDSDWYDDKGQWHKGEYLLVNDKGCSTGRTALAMRDATGMLCAFARDEARPVIHLWDAPEVVRRYLETGDETIREAAEDDAVRAAAEAVRAAEEADPTAWYAARAAAWAAGAAWGAARAAAEAARAATGAAGAAREAARREQRQRFNAAVARLFAEPAP